MLQLAGDDRRWIGERIAVFFVFDALLWPARPVVIGGPVMGDPVEVRLDVIDFPAAVLRGGQQAAEGLRNAFLSQHLGDLAGEMGMDFFRETTEHLQHILEIDHRPALDVYDEWLGGEIGRLMKEHQDRFDQVRALLTLHPLYRKYTASDGSVYSLFSHPWPKDKNLVERAVSTSTKIKVGERIFLSHGTWETLMNRIGNLPKRAKAQGGMNAESKPVFGIGYLCAGILGVIPKSERDKMPHLLNYANNDAPYIASFSWGEQGHFQGVGNKHGNLCTSFLVIGGR